MEEIAIVGMGCLFPGAESPEEFWHNLRAEVDITSPLSEIETGVDPSVYFDKEKGKIDRINYVKNGHIRGFDFDSQNYKLPQEYLDSLDPLFKWTLFSANHAIKSMSSAVENDLNRCGLIIGNIGMPTYSGKKSYSQLYHSILEPYIKELLDEEEFTFDKVWDADGIDKINASTCSSNAVVAAQALGINGPVFSLDAACSSALYAIKMASHYLLNGDADLMLSGAVCHADHVYIDHGFNVLQAFPEADGKSVPFDPASGGLKAGEGAGIVALRRLSDAVKNGDKILGVIESIGLSNDAGSKHILVPDSEGQTVALSRAYEGISCNVDYLECHATGTPVGDKAELNTIEKFFYSKGVKPLLGANKGNLGHMLTASGMASIMKVVLGMSHDFIPSTINVKELLQTKDSLISIDNVATKATRWPKSNGPKRAGINAFGFGGVNGHMVIRGHDNQAVQTVSDTGSYYSKPSLSIVGIGIELPGIKSVEAYKELIRSNEQLYSELPETRWSGLERRKDILGLAGLDSVPEGSYIESFEFDCIRYKLPPNVIGLHLLSHMSMMKIARRAFIDAGYTIGEHNKNIAVIIAGDMDYTCYRYQARNEISWQLETSLKKSGIHLTDEKIEELQTIIKDSLFPAPYTEGISGGIGNVVASRVSALLKLNGPALTLYSKENAAQKALELASFLLSTEEVDAVIIGSGSFDGSFENVVYRHQDNKLNDQRKTLGFDIHSNGWNIGEGGAAIVVKKAQDTSRDTDRVYADIQALNIQQDMLSPDIGFVPSAAIMEKTVKASLSEAGLHAEDINYIEAYASGIYEEDKAELDALVTLFDKKDSAIDATTYMGSCKSNYGHLGSASGIFSIVNGAISLYHQYIPGTPQWSGSKFQLDTSSLEVAVKNIEVDDYRYCLVNSMGRDRSYSNLVLSQADTHKTSSGRRIENTTSPKLKLLETIFIGREKHIADYIINKETLETFGRTAKPEDILDKIHHDVQGQKNIVSQQNKSHSPADSQSITNQPQDCPQNSNIVYLRDMMLNNIRQSHYDYLSCYGLHIKKISNLLVNSGESMPSYGFSHLERPHTGNIDNENANNEIAEISNITPSPEVVFDLDALIELTNGSVEKVLGSWYKEVDEYLIRTRMPSRPFMFVSRITKITAEQGKLEPCEVEWEYDLPADSWFNYHGLVPSLVSLESSHAMIVAFTVIGCDKIFKGELKYRAIDSETRVFSRMPMIGEVLQGKVDILSFTRAGKDIIIKYQYSCYVKGRKCFTLTATSGFFTEKTLSRSKPINTAYIYLNATPSKPFTPPLICTKTEFSGQDILALQNGDISTCFGQDYKSCTAPGLYNKQVKMLDRVINVDPSGGAWGLGQIITEADIDPSHWVFDAHFINDPVVPGTLIVEGCEQAMKFYLYYLGFNEVEGLVPAVIPEHKYSAKFRGEVRHEKNVLRYKLTCKSIDIEKNEDVISQVTLIFIVEMIYEDKVIGICDELGTRFERLASNEAFKGLE